MLFAALSVKAAGNTGIQSITLSPSSPLTLTGNSATLSTYTTSVSTTLTSVTQTITAADPTATITVNGAPVISGTASGSIPLNASGTTIITTVVSQGGGSKTYQIIISKNGSSNANLQSISIVPASTLVVSSSSSSLITYTTSVNAGVTSITEKVTAQDPTATLKVNGITVVSGTSSGSIPLNSTGTTTINTVVTAENGNTKTYRIIVSKNGSNNTNLQSLSIVPASTLIISSNTASLITYVTSVGPTIASITQKAVAQDAGATITVNGVSVGSGVSSGSIPLNATGTTTVNTVVTAEDGTIKTYRIIISKNGSNNANLKSISLTPASILVVSASSASLVTYTTSVSTSVTSVTQKAIVQDPGATVTVNGISVASGVSSGNIALNATGTTTINTVVTAENGTTKTYQIIISKNGSNNANLQSISLTPVSTLTIASNSATLVTYTTSVGTSVTSVTQKAVAQDPTATMTVNGVSVASGASSGSIALNATGTTTINTIVTAENGDTKTYQIIISKGGASSTTWLGTINNTWEVAGNWSSGIPASNTDVIIPATANMPILNAPSVCSSITVSGNTTITLLSSLRVTSSLTLNNGFTASFSGSGSITSIGAINLNDNSSLNNSSTINAGISGSVCAVNLSGANSAIINTGSFNLGPASVIYPTGMSSAVKNNGPGIFTLQSDASGSAAIGTLASGASCTGTFSVQRYVTANRGYRLLTSPVYNSTVGSNKVYSLNYLSNTAYITGTTGTGGGFDKTGNPTIYLYRQDVPVSNASFTSGNFRGINSLTSAPSYTMDVDGGPFNIPTGTGYLFFFRGDRASGTLTNETTATFTPTVATFTTSGSLNQGNVDVKNWYGATDLRSAITGYTLTGNPYASSIDWDTFNGANGTTGITGTNIFPTIYVFNPSNKQYGAYMTNSDPLLRIGLNGATNVIASGQGFFVQADPSASGAANLTFSEAAKIPASQATGAHLMMGTPKGAYDVRQILRLKLVIDTLNYDDIVIAFNSNSSTKYNNMEDSQYLTGLSAPEGLASFSSDSVPLSINFLPLPKKTQQVIRLKVTATSSGQLTLKKTQLDKLPPIYELWLMDRYKKDSLDLRNNANYVFDISKSDTGSYGDNRFYIIARQNKALGVHLLNFTATKQPASVPIAWKTENEENYTNFTVQRSTDGGVTFDVLGGFASNSQGDYTFVDKNPVNTVDIYRLKIEDLNGDITYSKAITVIYDPSKVVAVSTKINIFPNPAVGMVHVAINQPGLITTGLSGVQSVNHLATLSTTSKTSSYGIKIISITGSIVKTATSTTPDWQDNISSLLPGTYIIQVVNNSDNSLVGKSSFVKL